MVSMGDEFYLSLAIDKAWDCQLLTYPNPAVGAVILDENGQILSIARRHFDQAAGSIRQNAYIMRRALWLISSMDPDFVEFYTRCLKEGPSEKEQLRQAMFQYTVENEADDTKTGKFLDVFLWV